MLAFDQDSEAMIWLAFDYVVLSTLIYFKGLLNEHVNHLLRDITAIVSVQIMNFDSMLSTDKIGTYV